MHLVQVQIHGIRALEHFHWEPEERKGWHVFLGPNGSGKSTLMRTIALTLVGPKEIGALRQDWRDWLSVDQKTAHCRIDYDDDGEAWDPLRGRGPRPQQYYPHVKVTLRRTEQSQVELHAEGASNYKKLAPEANIWGSSSG